MLQSYNSDCPMDDKSSLVSIHASITVCAGLQGLEPIAAGERHGTPSTVRQFIKASTQLDTQPFTPTEIESQIHWTCMSSDYGRLNRTQGGYPHRHCETMQDPTQKSHSRLKRKTFVPVSDSSIH